MKKLLIILSLTFLFAATVNGAVSTVIVVNTPVGQNDPGNLKAYQSYVTSFTAEPGDRLSLAFGVGEIADVFVATGDTGLALFDGNSNARSGNLTNDLALWRIGDTVFQTNEAPYPGALFVWLTALSGSEFQVSITNFSAEYTLSPGLVLTHDTDHPLFTNGQPDYNLGLRDLANGNPHPLVNALQSTTSPPASKTRLPAAAGSCRAGAAI